MNDIAINQLYMGTRGQRYEGTKVRGDEGTRGRRYEGMNHLLLMHEMSYYKMCTRVQAVLVLEVTHQSHDL